LKVTDLRQQDWHDLSAALARSDFGGNWASGKGPGLTPRQYAVVNACDESHLAPDLSGVRPPREVSHVTIDGRCFYRGDAEGMYVR